MRAKTWEDVEFMASWNFGSRAHHMADNDVRDDDIAKLEEEVARLRAAIAEHKRRRDYEAQASYVNYADKMLYHALDK